jgi:hypothetical protein
MRRRALSKIDKKAPQAKVWPAKDIYDRDIYEPIVLLFFQILRERKKARALLKNNEIGRSLR